MTARLYEEAAMDKAGIPLLYVIIGSLGQRTNDARWCTLKKVFATFFSVHHLVISTRK
jgi:hypothetical protein